MPVTQAPSRHRSFPSPQSVHVLYYSPVTNLLIPTTGLLYMSLLGPKLYYINYSPIKWNNYAFHFEVLNEGNGPPAQWRAMRLHFEIRLFPLMGSRPPQFTVVSCFRTQAHSPSEPRYFAVRPLTLRTLSRHWHQGVKAEGGNKTYVNTVSPTTAGQLSH